MPLPPWLEILTIAVLVAVVLVDLVLAWRRPHVPTPVESALWIGFYVVLALLFAGLMLWIGDADDAALFVAGWLTEYSLSVDNLFVFVLIMSRLAVPRRLQQDVLLVGILIALVLRGIFIAAGVALIDNFAWVFYLFGAFLLYTAVKQVIDTVRDAPESEGAAVAWLRRRFRVTPHFDGTRLTTTVDGKRMLTPLLIAFLAIGMTDVLFALDSIPAIFGITQDGFLVFTANVFALMGLRQLYFLLGHLLERLAYLAYGIAAILAFIAVKLILHALHLNDLPFVNGGHGLDAVPDISTGVSLAVIAGILVVSVGASLIRLRWYPPKSGTPQDGDDQ